MNLSRKTIASIKTPGLNSRQLDILSCPKKSITIRHRPVLLRGLPDYFVDKANKQGIFNGRIVGCQIYRQRQPPIHSPIMMVSTTVCAGHRQRKKSRRKNTLNASISRVLAARKAIGTKILKCAANPYGKLIISNTTEVGITLVKDNVHACTARIFPRQAAGLSCTKGFKVFQGDKDLREWADRATPN